jgi:hypothetical protein
MREILSHYDANQLNHLVGTKWGIRFKGKGDYVQFYLEKLSMDSYIKGVLRKLSDDELELLKLMVIREDPVSEDILKKINKWSFVGAMSTLMSYFLVYSYDDQYYVPEELIEPLKRVLNIEEKSPATVSEIGRYMVKGNLAYDMLAILWLGATSGIELTQRGEIQKYSAEKLMQIMNSSDEFVEAKMRTCIRYLLDAGALRKKDGRMITNMEVTERILKGSDIEVLQRFASECESIAVLVQGSYVFRQVKGVHELLQILCGLERGVWYDLDSTIDELRRGAIRNGKTERWMSGDMNDYMLFLGWLGFITLAESTDGKKAFRVDDREGGIECRFIIINPDFEITTFVDSADLFDAFRVMCCGVVEHIDVATRVRLGKEQVILASTYLDNPVSYLKRLSMKPVPDNVEIYVREWLCSKKTATIRRATIISVEKRSYLDEIVIKYPENVERISPRKAIIDDCILEKLREEGYALSLAEESTKP